MAVAMKSARDFRQFPVDWRTPQLRRLGIGLACIGVASLLRLLSGSFSTTPYLLFDIAIALATWWAGWPAGLTAVAVAAGLTRFFAGTSPAAAPMPFALFTV